MDFMNNVHKAPTTNENQKPKSQPKNKQSNKLCCLNINKLTRKRKENQEGDEVNSSTEIIIDRKKKRNKPLIRTFLDNFKRPMYSKVHRNSGEKMALQQNDQNTPEKQTLTIADLIQDLKVSVNSGDEKNTTKRNLNSELYKLQICESKLNVLFGRQGSNNNSNGFKNVNLNQFADKNLTNQDLMCLLEILDNRIDAARWKAESANYLQWIGMINSPNEKQCGVPGLSANPPNPYLPATRLTDSEIRITLAEHQKLCGSADSVNGELRELLRTNEFNNWFHSDAMLMRLVREMYTDLGLVEPALPIKVEHIDSWLQIIYKYYNQVPFHNFKHAFMVTQMSYVLITQGKLKEILDKFDQCVLITAAICHDLDHPGFNNSYQINARTQLAIRYNDRSPLENHHASTAFNILYCEGPNPFKFDAQTEKNFREAIIKCILATDMSSHNEILTAFTEKVLNNKEEMLSIDKVTGRPKWVIDSQTRYLVMSILIKVSDISNESRPINVASEWIDRLLEEFFIQSDYEKNSNLPYAPFMDRAKVSKPASQCSFIQFVILPLFKSLCDLIPDLESVIIGPTLNQLDYYTKLLPESSEKQEDS